MVRFKNRYLLVELVPMQDLESTKPYDRPSKKARLMDLVKEPTEDPLDEPGVLDPSATSAYLQGLTSSNAASYIRQSLETNFGVHAAATNAQSFSVKYCNTKTGTLLIRAARDSYQQVWASLTFLTGLPSDMPKSEKNSLPLKCVWKVVHVSGTIRSAQKNAIKRSAFRISSALEKCHDPSQRTALEAIAIEAEKALKSIEA